MAARSRRRMALVAVAALCIGVPACGRSVSSTQGQGSGIVSPTKGLVATTPAGTKPVQSVTWAVYRDVNSLDPIFAFDYPENTADPEVVVAEITHHGWSKAAGEPYRHTALGVIRVRDGQIVHYDDYMNPIALARLLSRTSDLAAALAQP